MYLKAATIVPRSLPDFPNAQDSSMIAGLDALPDDVLLQLIKACSRDTPDAGGMPELEVRARSSACLSRS